MNIRNKIITIVKLVFIATSCIFIAFESNAQTNNNLQPTKNNDTISQHIAKDSIISDREVEIDLEKLSRLATLHARGTVKNAPSNGLVVLDVSIDSTGYPYSFTVAEISDDAFGNAAIDAVRQYAKRYKIKPAMKDGKPINSPRTLIPIIFDMAIFDKK